MQKIQSSGDWADVVTSLPYPAGAVPVMACSGKVAAAQAQATLAAQAGKKLYVLGYEITGGGATAASLVEAVLAGLIGGNVSVMLAVPAGVTAQGPNVTKQFTTPLAAADVNTAVSLTVPTLGAGNTACVATIWGYYL